MKSRKTPFTLIEVVIALGIFAVVSLLIATTFFTMQRSWIRIKKQTKSLNAYQTIDRVVDYAFRNAVPFKWRDKNLKDSLVFKGDSNEVTLAYLHRVTNIKKGGIRFMKLVEENDNLVAYYRHTPILYWLNEDLGSTCQKEVIAQDVENISFLYADRDENGITWVNDWNEEIEKNIPLAIQMTIKFKDGRKVSWLRRTAGNSFETNYGKRETVIK
jgi:type II secretory pathway component PulJ